MRRERKDRRIYRERKTKRGQSRKNFHRERKG